VWPSVSLQPAVAHTRQKIAYATRKRVHAKWSCPVKGNRVMTYMSVTYKDALSKLQLDCGYQELLSLQNKMKTDSTFLGWSFHYLFFFISFFPSAFYACLCVFV